MDYAVFRSNIDVCIPPLLSLLTVQTPKIIDVNKKADIAPPDTKIYVPAQHNLKFYLSFFLQLFSTISFYSSFFMILYVFL